MQTKNTMSTLQGHTIFITAEGETTTRWKNFGSVFHGHCLRTSANFSSSKVYQRISGFIREGVISSTASSFRLAVLLQDEALDSISSHSMKPITITNNYLSLVARVWHSQLKCSVEGGASCSSQRCTEPPPTVCSRNRHGLWSVQQKLYRNFTQYKSTRTFQLYVDRLSPRLSHKKCRASTPAPYADLLCLDSRPSSGLLFEVCVLCRPVLKPNNQISIPLLHVRI